MKKIVLFFVLILLINSIFATEIRKDSYGRKLYASDRIEVKLNEEASGKINALLENNNHIGQTGLETLDALNFEYGVTKIILAHRAVNDKVWEQRIGFDRWYLFFVSEKTDIENAIKQYNNNEYVEYANPEYIYYLAITPDDPYFADCWGHDNTEMNGPGSGHTIGFDSHIEEAWDDEQSYGSSDIIIAILDTGVDYNHEDLSDHCIPGYDYGDNDNDPMPDYVSVYAGHGTCCAGIAAAIVNNGIGISGVAGGCSIMPLKVYDNLSYIYHTYINNALTHCGDYGVDVACMSIGLEGQQGSNPSADAAIAYAYDHGVTLLAATHNFNTDYITHPANDEHVIAVGAASPCAERKSYTSCDGENYWGSNYGVDIQDARDAVEVIAPTILPTTDVTGDIGYSTGDYFMLFSGTSCATPYASGVAALIKSKNPSLTPAQVRYYLTSTAIDIIDEEPTPGWDRYTGYGMVNADAAVAAVTSIQIPGNIEGNVNLNGGNGNVEEVIVNADSITTNPDAAGNYSLEIVAGIYNVIASLEGYASQTIEAVEVLEDSTTSEIDFVLEPEVEIDNVLNPVVIKLEGNYPNPFNPETTILFSLAQDAKNTEIIIYNIKGQKVKTLLDKQQSAGYHTVMWNGKDNNGRTAASGLYFYKMVSEGNSGRYTSTKKMILLK
ncbi:MAG: S8 family serine peptidase [Candidatus Cloacimonetes bacterium]|nr:S8 family serine peptidase [Candidatus Cloacimonadota bacterium]